MTVNTTVEGDEAVLPNGEDVIDKCGAEEESTEIKKKKKKKKKKKGVDEGRDGSAPGNEDQNGEQVGHLYNS